MTLMEICEEAYERGKTINIDGCHYGPHSRTKRYYAETEYYRFLAGLCSVVDAKQVLEIGTHYGGSIMAMSRGTGKDAFLVTVDVIMRNTERFKQYPNVHRVLGNSISDAVAKKVYVLFHPPIDVLYIDSTHTYEDVMANIQMYKGLKPRFVVLDDIHINDSMKSLWTTLQNKYECIDVSEWSKRNVGFGVVKLNA